MSSQASLALLFLLSASTSNAGTAVIKMKPAPKQAAQQVETTSTKANQKPTPVAKKVVKPVAKNKDIAVLEANVMHEIVGSLASNVEVMRSFSSNLAIRIEGNAVVPTFVKMHGSCYQIVETPEHLAQRQLDKTELFSKGQTLWLPSEDFSLEPAEACPVLKKKTKEPVLFYEVKGKTLPLSFKFKTVKEFTPQP